MGASGGAGAGSGAGGFEAISAGMGMISSLSQAEAAKDQGEFANKMAKINARRAESAAEDAIRRGEVEAEKYGSKVRQTIGSQKANLAAQGIVVSSGDAAALQRETKETGAENIETIRNNAYREAMGFKMQANEALSRGRIAQSTGNYNAASTIAAGGMKAAMRLSQSGIFDNMSFGNKSEDGKKDYAINTRSQPEEAFNGLFGGSSREVVG